ncbi:MAG: transposase [Pseudomonadota bacterium]
MRPAAPHRITIPHPTQGDVIILDNLSLYKSHKADELMREFGAWVLVLPPHSPTLNRIEMVFAKIRSLIRRAAARPSDALWQAVGHLCDLFTQKKFSPVLKAAGYDAV